MKKTTKIFLIIACTLILIGSFIFILTMSIHNWNFDELNFVKFIDNTYEINDEFNDIIINSETTNFELVLSNDDTTKIVCHEKEKEIHGVYVKEDKLMIKNKNKQIINFFGFVGNKAKITLYLNKANFSLLNIETATSIVKISSGFTFNNASITLSTGNVTFSSNTTESLIIESKTGNVDVDSLSTSILKIKTSTGNISIKNITCTNIDTFVETGRVSLTNVTCEKIKSNGSTGNIFLDNVITNDEINIKRSTGNVNFNKSDAKKIVVETSTGNVTGNLLTNKIFITKTSTGLIDVPFSNTGGTCEVKTSTGNIKLKIA